MAKKKCYGVFSDTVKVKYGIGIFDNNSINKVRWVTEISYSPHKEFKFEWDKKAWFTEDREYAEQLATSMNVNMYPAFVIAVPELSDNYHDNFVNAKG